MSTIHSDSTMSTNTPIEKRFGAGFPAQLVGQYLACVYHKKGEYKKEGDKPYDIYTARIIKTILILGIPANDIKFICINNNFEPANGRLFRITPFINQQPIIQQPPNIIEMEDEFIEEELLQKKCNKTLLLLVLSDRILINTTEHNCVINEIVMLLLEKNKYHIFIKLCDMNIIDEKFICNSISHILGFALKQNDDVYIKHLVDTANIKHLKLINEYTGFTLFHLCKLLQLGYKLSKNELLYISGYVRHGENTPFIINMLFSDNVKQFIDDFLNSGICVTCRKKILGDSIKNMCANCVAKYMVDKLKQNNMYDEDSKDSNCCL